MRSEAWWLGDLAREVGDFLAGYVTIESLRAKYRQFYGSEFTRSYPDFRAQLAAPTTQKKGKRGLRV